MASKYEPIIYSNEELRIVLVGKTGAGKSSTGNTILGEKIFKSMFSFKSLTSSCQKADVKMNGQTVSVIDTPGLFDNRYDEEKTKKDISQCISYASPGPHVFLVVIRLGRYTEEEMKTVEKIQEIFGEEADKYSMVLFTHGDLLEGEPIEECLEESEELQELVAKCNGQYQVFNNKVKDRSQVRELLNKIQQITEKNGGNHYTTEMFQKAARAIEEKKQQILKENEEKNRKEREELEKEIKEKYEREMKQMKLREALEREIEEERQREARRGSGFDSGHHMWHLFWSREYFENISRSALQISSSLHNPTMASTNEPIIYNNEELRIVLVGKTGAGKSATGNTILGEKIFKSKFSFKSLTSSCDKADVEMNGQTVSVIDTPGLFDTRYDKEKTKEDISQCISYASPGPHVFLVVIKLGRFTEEEMKTVEKIQEIFGEEADKYSMVLFTHGDLLEGEPIEECLEESEELQKLVAKCNGQYQVFNNKVEDRSQVRELLNKIQQITKKNGGNHYTTEMFQKAARAIEEKKQQILKENEEKNRKEQEKLEKELKEKYEREMKQMKNDIERQWKLREACEREIEEERKKLKEMQEWEARRGHDMCHLM